MLARENNKFSQWNWCSLLHPVFQQALQMCVFAAQEHAAEALGPSAWRWLVIYSQRLAQATKETLLMISLPDTQLSSSPAPHPELPAGFFAASCCSPRAPGSGARRMCPQQERCQPTLPSSLFHLPLFSHRALSVPLLCSQGHRNNEQAGDKKAWQWFAGQQFACGSSALTPGLAQDGPWEGQAHGILPSPSKAAQDPAQDQRLSAQPWLMPGCRQSAWS